MRVKLAQSFDQIAHFLKKDQEDLKSMKID